MTNVIGRLIGHYGFLRTNCYRLGRWLYLTARRDVSNSIYTDGELMVQEAVLSARGGEETVVFDVGANVGEWTTELVARHNSLESKSSLKVHLFEPSPNTHRLLKEKLTGTNASLHFEMLALSSMNGKAGFYLSDDASGTNSLYQSEQFKKDFILEVETRKLDDYCQAHSIDHIDLVKVDTEGHDLEVVRGAGLMLESGRISVVQFEYNHLWVESRSYLRDVFRFVEALPYTLAKVTPDCVESFDQWHPELEKYFEGNFLLIHESARRWFNERQVHINRFNAMQVNSSD